MISGNPGLIGFYEPFLSTIRQLLDESQSPSNSNSTRIHLYGQDLAGFSDADHDRPFTLPSNPPRDLEYQIKNTEETLRNLYVDRHDGSLQHRSQRPVSQDSALPFDDIVLIGHSVGSYIALELFHRNLALRSQTQQETDEHSTASGVPSSPARPNLRSAILLFPTITHIAKSAAGKRLDLLRQIPILGPNAYLIARGLLSCLPVLAVSWIVSSLLRFPPHASAVLVPWLKSRDGVWQALYMGMDEMRVIREDKWGRELWDIEHATPPAPVFADAKAKDASIQTVSSPPLLPKFFFFFGQNDHWVADHYRDLFIASRNDGKQPVTETTSNRDDDTASDTEAAVQSSTRIIVDEDKLPHAFCIHHSETVGEIVHTWLRELYPVSS